MSPEHNPILSIITPCFNSGEYIEATIQSIACQRYQDYEHIVVDGGSSDATVTILQRYPHVQWISEPDRGQSDAINKGFSRARGTILAWQNADDLYLPDAFATVAAYFAAHPEVDVVYGNYQLIDMAGNWICDVHPPEWQPWLFAHGRFVPPQPAAFWRRRVWEQAGQLDLSLKYCMDVDFYARALRSFRFAHLPQTLGQFRVHTASKTQDRANERKVYREHLGVLARHFAYTPLDLLIFHLFYYRARLAKEVKTRWIKKPLPRLSFRSRMVSSRG